MAMRVLSRTKSQHIKEPWRPAAFRPTPLIADGYLSGDRLWVPGLRQHDKQECSRHNDGMSASPPASATTLPPLVPRLLAARLPVSYGWVVLGCLCSAGFARQGPAVATLSIFVGPLTGEFGWSRTALSGAVSLGGLLAAVASPLIGPLLDRRGSRLVLCMAVLVHGVLLLLVGRPGGLGLGPEALRSAESGAEACPMRALPEPAFSRRQAFRTPAFWLLLLYSVLLFPVQAGVRLHQAPYLVARGFDATTA